MLWDINISSGVPSMPPARWAARGGPATSFPTLVPHGLLQSPQERSCSPSTGSLAAGAVAFMLQRCCQCLPTLTAEQLPSHRNVELSPSPFGVCLLGQGSRSLPVPSPSHTLPFQGYGPEKLEWRGVCGLNCLLLDGAGGFPGAGLAHTELRRQSRCRRVWLGHGPSVPTWDVCGHRANHLLFSVFPTPVAAGKEFVGILFVSERLRCRGNSTIETFFLQLHTKLAPPGWIRRPPADLKGTKQNFY